MINSMETGLATMIGHQLWKRDPVIVRHGELLLPSDDYTDVCLFVSHAGLAYTYSYYYPMWFLRNDDVWVGHQAVDMEWQK